MIDSFYLAWRYIVFNSTKSIILIICITLIAFLPFALKTLLKESENQLLSRANTTPLLVGAKGNALDLTMNSLYFAKEKPEFIPMIATKKIINSNLGLPIPLYVRFQTKKHPIVATSIDYFSFRKLKINTGRNFVMLGECVIGKDVATSLKLTVGDNILSSPDNLFDLGGIYPLKMTITGVLEKANTADDKAVFIDLKTAWVIEGLGHGHEDIKKIQDTGTILNSSENLITASAKLNQFTEINQENLKSFHFHGDTSNYPLTAIIVAPKDNKSATLLRGRYLSGQENLQLIRPKETIEDLLGNIFRIKSFFDAVVLIVAIAMILAVILVFSLSFRLRQKEIKTIAHLGCSRTTVIKLITAEILIIVIFSSALCFISLLILQQYQDDIVHRLFLT